VPFVLFCINNNTKKGRLIENLADLGYDESMLHMASYDWRMAPQMLEQRDHYFTLLMQRIETFKVMTGERVVIVAHSMGRYLFVLVDMYV
jgi:phospholipid:diacylglycerol acyltransferase